MEAKPREILIYCTANGKEPLFEFMGELQDDKGKAAILVRLNRLESGNFGDSEPVGEGLIELRIHHGPGYRVYVGEDGNTLVVVLCAGRKNTQSKDIKSAKRYWKDYRENKP